MFLSDVTEPDRSPGLYWTILLARNSQKAAIVLTSLPASDLFASAFRPPLCRLLPGFGFPAQSDKDDFNY